MSKYNVELKILVLQGLSEPEFNGDLVTKCLRNQGRNNGECWSTANLLKPSPPPVISLLAVPKRLFCFGLLVILDVARGYLWSFSFYINIEIGKKCC